MQASSLQPIENLDTQFFELSPLTTMVLRWAKFSRLWRILRVACYLATKTPSWYSTIIAGKRFRRQKPVLSGRSPLITMEWSGSVAVPRLVTSPESMVDTGWLRSTTDRLG